MNLNLSGRTALVTGASMGLGRAMATAFHGAGANVALLARRQEPLDEARAAIAAEDGGGVGAYSCDVTDPAQIERTVASVVADLGAVAASLSHQMPMVPGAARDDPALRPSPERVRANLHEVASAAAAAGADLLLLEMMSRPLHIAPAIAAAEESGLPYWCGLSARLEGGEVVSFAWESLPFEESVAAVLAGRPEAVGIMHTHVDAVGPALEILKRFWKGPLMAYPDSGFFEMPRWRFEDVIAPDDLARRARSWRERGVQVFGGCCGLGPEHIRALAAWRRAG